MCFRQLHLFAQMLVQNMRNKIQDKNSLHKIFYQYHLAFCMEIVFAEKMRQILAQKLRQIFAPIEDNEKMFKARTPERN